MKVIVTYSVDHFVSEDLERLLEYKEVKRTDRGVEIQGIVYTADKDPLIYFPWLDSGCFGWTDYSREPEGSFWWTLAKWVKPMKQFIGGKKEEV